MFDEIVMSDDSVRCHVCEEPVPRGHTVLRADLGRVCWFCHTYEVSDDDDGWSDDDDCEWDDDDWYND